MSGTELPAEAIVNYIDEHYTGAAHRTLVSGKLHPENVGYRVLYSALVDFVDAGQRLDAIKKAMVYDKFDADLLPEPGDPTVKDNGTLEAAVDRDIFHSILGMATEASELVEALLTAMDDETEFDMVNFKEEIGDVMWYMVIGAAKAGFTVGEACHTNIEKLSARFPEKFTDADALNRDLVTERKILEST